MRNPHSPSDDWLKAIAGTGGYSADPDVGDSGEQISDRESGTYKVIVEKIDE